MQAHYKLADTCTTVIVPVNVLAHTCLQTHNCHNCDRKRLANLMKKFCFPLDRYSLIAVMKDRIYLVNSWPFLVRYSDLCVSSKSCVV